MVSALSSVELCAGAGGQALGLERAGFDHEALFENDPHACETLRSNRPHWQVKQHDLFQEFDFSPFVGVDLLAGGLPCPPFSVAGKQLGEADDRNLFSRGVDLVELIKPQAVLFENVRGMLGPSFSDYRDRIELRLRRQGYWVAWKLLNASDFGVPQLRPRVVMVALRTRFRDAFVWPVATQKSRTVGDTLFDLMAEHGWLGAASWRLKANAIAPTIVGGSKKHGGPDLGPTRARNAWLGLGVDGTSVTDRSPDQDFVGNPKLTVRMVARLQGFPDDWTICGKKTAAYRQVGNAFPPPFAEAVGRSIAAAIGHRATRQIAAE
jgi:DNA (cytosine-5)-methyltransferase 1